MSKTQVALAGSLAANIFLVAFVLGRSSAPGMMPPPPFGGPPPGGPGMHGEMPPPPPGGGMFGEGPPPGGPGGPGGPPPHPHMGPPLFAPHELFTPEEMKADFSRMQENFEKMKAARTDFATKLKAGPLTKDDVLKHFADVDQLMEGVRKATQDKAAEKISKMSDEDRQKFADKLLEKR